MINPEMSMRDRSPLPAHVVAEFVGALTKQQELRADPTCGIPVEIGGGGGGPPGGVKSPVTAVDERAAYYNHRPTLESLNN